MQYITAKDAAARWGITERRVCKLCIEGRIEGATKFGGSWAIPADTEKPSDARVKKSTTDYFASKGASDIRIERVWAMPNKNTFSIPPISMMLEEELTDGLWIDPFANKNKYASITNDLNPEYDTDYHLDALDFLKLFDANSVDGVLYDPPFSPRQVSECYNNVGYNVTWDTTKASFWGNHKREISRIVKVGGKVITFGWNSGGIGAKYGFQIERILLVPHGGWHNDTICTIERKVRDCAPAVPSTPLEEENMRSIHVENAAIINRDEQLIAAIEKLPAGFWDFKDSDTREMTHGIHMYPAMMIYPISRNILSIMKNIMDVSVLMDPFSGSGTVLVEGTLAGVDRVLGNDINPLALLLSNVKTYPIDISLLNDTIAEFKKDLQMHYEKFAAVISFANSYFETELGLDLTAKDGWATNAGELLRQYLSVYQLQLDIPNFKNMGYWFKPNVIIELQLIKDAIKRIGDVHIRNFMWVNFSETIRLVSNRRNGEFKMFRMTPEKVYKFNPSVEKEFYEILNRNVQKMCDYVETVESLPVHSDVTIFNGSATDLANVADDSVDLIITSPPYGDSRTTVAYGEFSRLSLQWIDLYELDEKTIMGIDRSLMGGKKFRNGFEYHLHSDVLAASLAKIMEIDVERAGDVYSFYADLEQSIAACARTAKSGSYQFWVVGNRTVKGENLQTDVIISEMAAAYGVKHVYTIDREISNKVMPSRNSPSNISGDTSTTMCNEHIVVLRKE